MLRKGKSVLAILAAVLILFSSVSLPVSAAPTIIVTDGAIVTLQTPNYTVKVAKNGFRYGFYRPDGTAFADMHATAGISFGKAGNTPYDANTSVYKGVVGDTASFEVTNTNSEVADVSMQMFDHYVKFSIVPKTGGIQGLNSTLPQTVVLGASTVESPGASTATDELPPQNSAADQEIVSGGQQAASLMNTSVSDSSQTIGQAELLAGAQAGGYLHMLGGQDTLNATVYRLVTPGLPNDYIIEADVKIDAGSAKSVGIYTHYNASNAFHLFFIKAGSAGLTSLGLKRLSPTTTVDLGPASITAEGSATAIQAGTWYHLKMVVQQRALQCYLNGILVFNAVDSGASSAEIQGGCGLRADKTGACFDNVSVTGTDGAVSYFGMDFETTDGIAGWQHTKWEKMLGSSGAEHVAAGGTATAVPAYDPNSNTYLYIKPSDLNSVSVKELTDADIPDDNYTLESRVRFENAVAGTSSTGLFAHYNAPTAFHLFFAKNGGAYLKRLIVTGTSPTLGDKVMPAILANKWYRMKLVAAGKSIKCYLGGQLIFDANDTSASAAEILGGCGLRVYKDGACFDDIKVYSNSNPLDIYYENDFEGKVLSEVSGDFAERLNLNAGADISTMQLKSEVRADNPDAQLDNKYLLLTASPMTSAVVTAGSAWGDYTVSADTSFTIGDEQTANSLLMRYTDNQHYYRFGFLKHGYVSLIKNVGGVETVIQETPFDYSYDKFYNLKAQLSGQSITCFVDNTQVLTATDSAIAQGTAGAMANVTAAKVDNFTVTGGASFADSFDGSLSAWTLNGTAVISYDGDPAQTPAVPDPVGTLYTIDARVEGNINPMYGLGDYGAVANTGSNVRETSNVFGVNRTTAGSFTNKDGGPVRFISNFSIAPQRGFAQVLFEEADKRVVINETQTMLGALETEKVTTLYYFLGDIKQIYKDYRDVRNAEGYKDTKPHYDMFGLGWEAFGALGWNAYQANVMETVQDYLDEGYNITWAVIGSGFWKGDRSGLEGTTTSFGMWDDTYDPAGRNDTAQGMPNPRFPDPAGIKNFFKDRDIKLLLGLRVHLKLPTELGGDWNPLVDGNFVNEALAGGLFLKNRDGSLMKINAKYPAGNRTRKLTAYVDGSNPDARELYRQKAALWGADGFKEDTMVLNGDRTYNDGNWNRLLSYMIEQDNSVMIMRNGAYALSGDILRINDANMGTSNSSFNNSPDRMPINVLAYAASGVSNAYPDIIGGTGGTISNATFQKYLVRNAQYAALNPSCSVGINALKMDNEPYKAATFNAINWHSTYAPYIYDAALKSWETGYPYSVTPLYIAYPDDSYTQNMVNTTEREYEWLLGESLLAAPQFGTDFATADTRDVYLPEGKWIDYSTGESFEGPLLLQNRAHPIENIPAFVGGKGVLVGEDMQNKGNYFAEVFPIANNGSTYNYTFIDGTTTSQITNNNVGWSPVTLKVKDTTANKDVTFTYNTVNKSIKFTYEAGHNYELTGGAGVNSLVSATAEVNKTTLSAGQTAQLSVTSGLNDDGTPANLDGAAYSYKTSDSSIVTVNSSGVITAVKEGSADVWASVALNNAQGTPITVDTNKLSITVSKPTAAISYPIYAADDFLSGSLTGWNNLAPEGSYSVQTIGENKVLQYAGAGKSGDRGTLLKGDMAWQDYTVESDITIPSAPSGKTVGLTLRYKDYNSCYVIGYTVGTGLRYIKRNGDGATPSIDSVSVPFTMNPGQTYHFKAVAKGGKFDLYVDDDSTPKLTVTDAAATAPVYLSGSAGVYASGMDATFDNFKVTTGISSLPFNLSGSSFGAGKVYLDVWNINTAVTPDSNGNWAYPVTYIPNGNHTVAASVKDNTGKVVNSASAQFVVSGLPDTLNKTALQTAIGYASSQRPAPEQIGGYDGQYPQPAVNTLNQAIAQAQLVYDTATVQADIDTATDNLYAAVTAFENSKVKINRTPLINAISLAQARIKGSYTAASKAQLQTAIDHAITVRNTVKVTQADLDTETAALLGSISKLAAVSSSGGSTNDSSSENTSSASTPDIVEKINTPSLINTVFVDTSNQYSISTAVFEALMNNPQKTLVLSNGWYSWSFNGSDIKTPLRGLAQFDTRLSATSPNASAIAGLAHGAKTVNLHFSYEGTLPGRATIRVQLPNYAGKALFIYYFNPSKNRLELLPSNATVDSNGWFAFRISHCSDYVVSPTQIEGTVTIPETGGSLNAASVIDYPDAVPQHDSKDHAPADLSDPNYTASAAIAAGILGLIVITVGLLLRRKSKG